jgi:hypothetical protein
MTTNLVPITQRSVVLRTESKDDYAKLLEQLIAEINPDGFIERMYVVDIVDLIWEIIRLRHVKTGILNNAHQAAVKNILEQILVKPSKGIAADKAKAEAKDVAYDWVFSERSKNSVTSMLLEVGLDESAITAEAYRLSINEIEKVDRALALTEARRDKTIRMIAECKENLSERLRRSAKRILDDDRVAAVETLQPAD